MPDPVITKQPAPHVQHHDGTTGDMALWKRLLIQIIPVVLAVIVSVIGAYIALNSQVSGLSVEVNRLSKIMDTLSTDGQRATGLAIEVNRLTVAVDSLKNETIKTAVRDSVLEQNRVRITKLEGDVQSLERSSTDLRVMTLVQEREIEALKAGVR